MEELNEEEMKNMGGACMKGVKPGYQTFYGKMGWFKAGNAITGQYKGKATISQWSVYNQGGGSIGKIIDKIEIRHDTEIWLHTSTGRGYCTIRYLMRTSFNFQNSGGQDNWHTVKVQLL